MAEPLETLLQMTARKRPQRLAQFQPATTIGDTGITSQAVADAAQGVDISDAYPNTRLRADRVDEVYAGETPTNLPPDQGGERNPFQLIPSGSQEDRNPFQLLGTRIDPEPMKQAGNCPGGICGPQNGIQYSGPSLMQAAPQMQATTLPPGVSLGPGETYVPGSLREGPPATASAMPATASPASPQQQLNPKDPMDPYYWLSQAQQQYQQALSSAHSKQAVPAMILKGMAAESQQMGFAAAVMRKKEEIAKLTAEIGDRGMSLQERKLDIEEEKMNLEARKLRADTGELVDEILLSKRSDRQYPPEYRARDVVATRAMWSQKAGIVKDEKALAQEMQQEYAIITAMDMGHYLDGVLAGESAVAQAVAAGQDPAAARARTLLLHGKMNELMAARFRDIQDPNERAVRMKAELTPVFESAYSRAAKNAGMKIGEDEVQARTIDQVDLLISDLEETMRGADPYRLYWQHQQSEQESPYRRAVQSAAPPEPEPIRVDSTMGSGYGEE